MFAASSHKSAKNETRVLRASAKPPPVTADSAQANPLWQLLATRAQAKLAVSAPDDPYEREADQVAEQVMRAPAPTIQRTCAACAADGATCPKCQATSEISLRQQADGNGERAGTVPDGLGAGLGAGHSLDPAMRSFMEMRFGRDFSQVQVHTDAQAEAAAGAINALAYTVGNHIGFKRGQYAPHTPAGGHLLAHELAHVVQQDNAAPLIQRDEDEDEDVEARHCGPDVTDWLINQMNTNQNHPVIVAGRSYRWPRWVPVFNIGWTGGALYDFYQLVAPGKPWDFKRTQRWWRAAEGRTCPTTNCDRTVTLCGHCVNYDVPGNIHFGWVGRRMELAPWALHFGAGRVQEGSSSSDDPPDTVAINIGIAMADEGKTLCGEVDDRLNSLNLDRTDGCSTCGS